MAFNLFGGKRRITKGFFANSLGNKQTRGIYTFQIDVENGELIFKKYFVTSFDLYALKKGVEVLKRLSLPVEITKVYFSNLMSQTEDDYFNYIATGCRVKWNQEKIYFPLLNEDLDVIKENQRLSKIRFKGLSNEYKTSLMEWTQDICGDSNGVKKACRQIERGV